MKKRLLSILTALFLALSLLPVTALAAADAPPVVSPSAAVIKNRDADVTANDSINDQADTPTIEEGATSISFNDNYNPGKIYDGAALADPTEEQLTITGGEYDYNDVTFTWYKYKDSADEDNELSGPPTDAGTYFVVAFIAGTESTPAVSATSDAIEIAKAQQEALSIEKNTSAGFGDIYYGISFNLTATGGSGTGAVTWAVTEGTNVATLVANTGNTVSVGVTGVGDVAITATKVGSTNYLETYATYTFTAKKRGITAEVAAEDKAYDGTTTAKITAKVATGSFGPLWDDEVFITGLTGTFADANAGENKPVTVDTSKAEVTGTNSECYSINYVNKENVTATIFKDTNPTPPAAGKGYTLDYAAETITVTDGYEVSTAETGGTSVSSGSISEYLGQTLYIRKVENSNHSASGWTSFMLTARPGAPGGITKTDETVRGKEDGKVTGITADMEYQTGGDWQAGGVDLEDLAAGTEVKVRVKATKIAPHGQEVTYTIGAGEAITVTFDSQDGSTVEQITDKSYGDTIAEPTPPTRTNYEFLGWYTEATGGNKWDFAKDTLTESITLYAQWKQVQFTVNGTVQANDGSTAIVGADVQLKKGNTEVDSGTTDENGVFTFSKYVPAGAYNIVIIYTPAGGEAQTTTTLVTITDSDTTVTVTLPPAGANSHLEVGGSTPAVVVGGLDKEAAALKIGDVSKVAVTMTVAAKAESAAAGADAIQQQAGTAATLEYLELKVTTTITKDGGAAAAEDVSETTTVLEIVVPFDFTDKETVKVYRYHRSSAETLTAAADGTKADGTYRLDQSNGLIHIFASKFSTYAIGYTESGAAEPDTPSTPSHDYDGSAPTYSPTLDVSDGGSVKVSPRTPEAGETVTITPSPEAGYDVGTVTDRNGKEIEVTEQRNSTYTFTQPRGRVTIEVTFVKIADEPESLPFVHVSTGAYYYDAVAWAAENGVTGGTSATTFSPNSACTRAQMVTFLWRAAGSPEPETTVNPFTDVSESAYYHKAVLWAVERGITNGTSATTFSPDDTVTRGQTVAFLWRNAGSPAAAGTSFADVAADAYYASAVAWAAREGITSGTSATTFSPDNACTRAQIVTFLYRDMVG